MRFVGDHAGQVYDVTGLPVEIAELLASFGKTAREGHLDPVSSSVEDLTGRAPRTVRAVLKQHRDKLAEAAGSVPA